MGQRERVGEEECSEGVEAEVGERGGGEGGCMRVLGGGGGRRINNFQINILWVLFFFWVTLDARLIN